MKTLTSLLLACLVISVATPQHIEAQNANRQDTIDSKIRHHLHNELAVKLNQQVSMELEASLTYMAMASWYGSETINRPGFAKFFRENSIEEREHAQKFVDYLNKRGSYLKSYNISQPKTFDWTSTIEALEQALSLEGEVTKALSMIHDRAQDLRDAHLTDFLESEFIGEQIESMRLIAGYVANLKAMSHQSGGHKHDQLAEYLFDLQLQGKN